MTESASRGLMIYLKTLCVAMDDEIVTDDEMRILNILANCLGLDKDSQKFANLIHDGVEKSPITSVQEAEWSCRNIGDATCYQSALIAALDDEVITEDEMSMLDCLRRAIGMQSDEHALVEEAVRAMIENFGDERLMVRLESYLTANPTA
ncbi:MAG TPA: hypothetical protein QF802_07100 [Candidatus Thalassarchaeaceae archaeon]|nr:hypothetical protein [Candidatus Thalassarchaeaceae archaeon]HJM20205.1 hypothetical protein [Candidatus Thalassarchaeaceae archaeon]HJM87668.1 hypothetical protein [Candidatus Thalassarchaeaceae archaeon]